MRAKLVAAMAAALCWVSAAQAQESAPLLNAMFNDHAVLQRGQPIRVYGAAAPGADVTVTLQGATAQSTADANGRWLATLPAQSAGGPYTLTARAGAASQTVNDVMVGDVFLCSGQSNMEWAVHMSQGAGFEIAQSANPRIRMITIPQAANPTPQENFARDVAWQVAGPETVGTWSASCFFMARELAKTVDAPIGLVHASWGGSNIRAWMSESSVENIPEFQPQIAQLRRYRSDPAAAQAEFGAGWENWWRAQTGDAPGREPWNRYVAREWRVAPAGLGNYRAWEGDPSLAGHTGMIWFRTRVRLTAAQAAQPAHLLFGGVDEVDTTWVNGRNIGTTFGYGAPRDYALPAGALRAGDNVIQLNVLNTWASGGLTGEHFITFADGSRVPLTGEWRYQVAPDIGAPPRTPWESVGGLTTMSNGMIAPIGPYNMRGAAWYQGESNASAPGDYQVLMRALTQDWRNRFHNPELAMLIVQLPNFGAPPTAPGPSGWAEVREAQRLAAVGDPHAGLAVTIDAGDPRDLHPTDKQEIGRRLARAARHVIYGNPLSASGPEIQSARRDGASVVLSFAGVDRELVTYSGPGAIGFELCGAEQASCRYVPAEASGSTVTLNAAQVSDATRVRYCWADSPICTLYDRSGAPAGPFEIRIE